MTEIDIKVLHEMISEIVKDEIDSHRHGCPAARDADFLERSITPSTIRISEYNEYKEEHDKKTQPTETKKKKCSGDLYQNLALLAIFILSGCAAAAWMFLNG